MKNTIGHPDAPHNYLVECSTQTRELFYLGCQLNRLDGMILSRTITKHMIRRLYEMRSDLINTLDEDDIKKLGIRGRLFEYIVKCNWDLEDYILMKFKEYGATLTQTELFEEMFQNEKKK